MNENVFMHSKVPSILRDNIPIENIEYGVNRIQMNRTDDIVPTGEIKTNETEQFINIVKSRLKEQQPFVADY